MSSDTQQTTRNPERVLRVYSDTSVLPHNIDRHHAEKAAMEKLLTLNTTGRVVMIGSRVILRETERTPDEGQRRNLSEDYDDLKPVAKDERVFGFHTETDQYGGSVSYPLVSDVQDEGVYEEICLMGLTRADAQHLTQAICDGCHVFLTFDIDSIIKHRAPIEARFPIRVLTPSELVRQLQQRASCL